MANKKTIVIGASENPSRYSHQAVKKLNAHGHTVIAIGRRSGKIDQTPIISTPPEVPAVNTVTLYLNQENQKQYEDYILSLKPQRIIFNPGAENESFAQQASALGIQTLEACTLVMLSTGQY